MLTVPRDAAMNAEPEAKVERNSPSSLRRTCSPFERLTGCNLAAWTQAISACRHRPQQQRWGLGSAVLAYHWRDYHRL
jgi:hypothetical protein